jgi:hypothetical protein
MRDDVTDCQRWADEGDVGPPLGQARALVGQAEFAHLDFDIRVLAGELLEDVWRQLERRAHAEADTKAPDRARRHLTRLFYGAIEDTEDDAHLREKRLTGRRQIN